jgi:hypothetical protein
MSWPVYVPSSATLVILFKIARARLVASSHNVALLSDARLISATEEMNRISDDISAAGDATARRKAEKAQPGCTRWPKDAELPIPDLAILAKVAAWMDLRHAINAGAEPPHPQPGSLSH